MSTTDAEGIGTETREIPGTKGLHLLEGEEVLENHNPHWSHCLKTVAVAAISVLLALSALFDGDLSRFGLFMAIVLVCIGYIQAVIDKVQYIVTNQRVIKRNELLNNTTAETHITEIKSLATSQPGLSSLFGTGTVAIDSTGAEGHLGIDDAKDYESIAHTIRVQKQMLTE